MNGPLSFMSPARRYGGDNINRSLWGATVNTVTQADARFLRRIFIGMVMLTILTGAMAGLATVNAMAAEGVDLCQATGLLCAN